ncbi:MAG: hypothetical protein LQ339_000918 [Xanthoria mediterranea]|nr:MAG: hypothetical protein LQ339_000918 [Xanthoria mediterranea]
MPPKSSLTSSFSASELDSEVVCPLKTVEGSNCRKRCLGEKRYRSMQEHIRRAHPEHYIAKLPATEESFQLMITTPPSEKPAPVPPQSFGNTVYGHDRDVQVQDYGTSLAAPRSFSESYPAAATAAVALAQLHNHRPDSEFGSEADLMLNNDSRPHHQSSTVELPPIQNHAQPETIPHFESSRPRELLPSIMARSPPGRSSTLPPAQRKDKPARPRKSSITKNTRKPNHERTKSKDYARRLSIEGRKALSAEPYGPAAVAQGKRWEDLLEAATSANEADSDRDLTPIPQSPSSVKRASLPPFASAVHHLDTYKASPLQRALTPPPPDDRAVEPFPSIESNPSSSASGHNFHFPPSGLSNSDAGTSPAFYSQPVQIFCANCRRISILKESYACTECISGFCPDCVYALSSEQNRGRPCPRCHVLGPRYKPFQLDLR